MKTISDEFSEGVLQNSFTGNGYYYLHGTDYSGVSSMVRFSKWGVRYKENYGTDLLRVNSIGCISQKLHLKFRVSTYMGHQEITDINLRKNTDTDRH